MSEIFHRNNATFKEGCAKKLIGQSVLTRYNNKMYRVKRLQGFIATINSNPASMKEMKNWNLEFAKILLTMEGCQLDT
jgi:hypothetical protein